MVYHIVMWNFKDEVAEADKPQIKATMTVKLKELVGKVPGLLTADFVTEPAASSTHELALITTFEKVEDIAVYAKHQEHVYVADHYVRPYVCGRACLDCEIVSI